MNQLTIGDIVSWLATLPPDTIVYFDSFELRHNLVAAYYEAQGTPAVGQYDRAIKRGTKAEILALYSKNLTACLYSLHYGKLRFTPTAAELRVYILNWGASDVNVPRPQPPFYTMSDEEMNKLFGGSQRPADVAWRHWEHVLIHGMSYRIMLSVTAASETYTPDILHNLPYSIFLYDTARELDLQLRHRHIDGNVGYGVPYRSDQPGCLSSLEAGAFVDLTLAYDMEPLATWQNKGDGILIRTPY
jgi:hypothetical protein